MTKFKKVLWGFSALYLAATLSLAHAQGAPQPGATSPKWHTGQHIEDIYNQLNLTDDQKKQLDSNKQQHRSKMWMARQQMKTYKEEMRSALMSLQLDIPKINQIHSQIKSLQDQMEDDKLSSILAVRAILTPEQFLKFVGLMHKHREEHEEHEQ